MAYSLRFQDRQLRIRLTHDEERYAHEDGDPLELTIRGEPHVLGAGKPIVVTPTAVSARSHTPARPRPW